MARRFWTMIAHANGNLLNMESLGNSLGISSPTVRSYLDFFEASYLVRRVQPWFQNIPKHLVKSPKVYLRDTGLLHALLAIGSYDQLMGYPASGASWEAYVIQELASMLPPRHDLYFYRTQDGTEADLLIVKAGIPDVLVEIKHSAAPSLTKSMRTAAKDLQARRNVIVVPQAEPHPLPGGFEVLGVEGLGGLFD